MSQTVPLTLSLTLLISAKGTTSIQLSKPERLESYLTPFLAATVASRVRAPLAVMVQAWLSLPRGL